MISCLLALLISLSAHAEQVRRASIYRIGEMANPPSYKQETKITKLDANKYQWISKIDDAAGTTVMTEDLVVNNGLIEKHIVENRPVKEFYELQQESGQGYYSYYEANEKNEKILIKKVKFDTTKKLINGALTELYIKENLSLFEADKSTYGDFEVFELLRSYEMKFKVKKKQDKLLRIEMRPANVFISLLVSPFIIDFDTEKNQVVRYEGRTPLREKKNDKWQHVEAEIVYAAPEGTL